MAEKIQLSKKDRLAVAWRSTFIQGSWFQQSKNYTKQKKTVPLL